MAATKRKAAKSKVKSKVKSKPKANNAYVKPVKLSSLSPKKRRVAIAEDVISGLAAKRLLATCGSYITSAYAEIEAKEGQSLGDDVEVCDLQKVIASTMKSCEVCAKGAMFIAAVEKFNNVKVLDLQVGDNPLRKFDDDEDVCTHLENYFSRDQLDLIEVAFEGSSMSLDENTEECQVALAYQHRYTDVSDRMTAIMENIVKNNGTFVCKL